MRCQAVTLAIAIHIATNVYAAPIKGIKRQVVEDEYDFVICGGGTAGLVVANRLSESGKNRVLVLEAGPEPSVVSAYKPPGGNQLLGGTVIDWNFYTVPQEHLNNRILPYHRGRTLGGSSVTNGLYYGRGTSTIYDRWVELGNPGWSWDEVYPLFVKGTHFNPPDPSRGFDERYKTWEPEAYGDGPLELGFQGYVPATSAAFVEACEAANIPIVKDLNTGNGTGVKHGTGHMDGDFMRSSSYDGYLRQALDRSNLDVLHYASVQRILSEKAAAEGDDPKVTGVAFIDHPTGLVHEVKALKEVILSMGAFHTPQLLMVSGFGPVAELNKYGIDPVLVNENIGQHLNDHSVFSIMATVPPEFSTSSVSANYPNLIAAQQAFYSNLSGPYTAPSGITNGFQQLSNEELDAIGAGAVVDAGLVNQAHIEYLYESIWYPGGPTPYYTPRANESYISLTASSMVALSRGNVTLKSDSMADAPNINPNYYADEADRKIAIQSFKYLRKILAHPALAQYGPVEVSPGTGIPSDKDESGDNDEAILDYVRAITIPNWHASGTARMLPLEDGGVVDSRLRVYGIAKNNSDDTEEEDSDDDHDHDDYDHEQEETHDADPHGNPKKRSSTKSKRKTKKRTADTEHDTADHQDSHDPTSPPTADKGAGLRIIDCSIIPLLPDVNIVGPVYMIGEVGAKFIREDWGDL